MQMLQDAIGLRSHKSEDEVMCEAQICAALTWNGSFAH